MRSITDKMLVIDAIAHEIGIYWAQAGHVPTDDDKVGIRTQASVIEPDLPSWMTSESVTDAIRHCRRNSKTVPAPSSIIEAHQWLKRQVKQIQPTAPLLEAPTKLDCWQELAFARCYPASVHRSKTPWVEDMLSRAPTAREADGFIRLFVAMCPATPGPHRKATIHDLAEALGKRAPYGFDKLEILRRCREHVSQITYEF